MAKNEQLNNLMVDISKRSDEGAKRLLLDIHGRLLESTPVLTGWAVNNWIPSVRVPFVMTDGSPENVSDSEQSKGVASVVWWKFFQGPAYITNNVPYIIRLNEGSSKQAPKGFVDRAVKEAVDKANKADL